MKSLKILLTGFAALIAVATASAQNPNATIIQLTGSTAFRASIHQRILSILSGTTYAYSGGDINTASQAIFHGNIGSAPYIFRTSWSGSGTGVQAVAQQLNVNFIATSNVGTSGGTPNTSGTDPAKPDLALSDVFQTSTGFRTPVLQGFNVGVIPFLFVANDGAPTGLNNINPQTFNNLFASGAASLQLFTGNPADHDTNVFAIGRTSTSGTRITALAETGYGIFKQVVQSLVTINGSGEITGITTPSGGPNGGYSTGGEVATALGGHSTAALGFFVSYLGEEDFNVTAVPGGAKALSYNGVAFSRSNVQNGNYTFWAYEHLYYAVAINPADTANPKTVGANTLRNALIADPGAAGVALSLMTVSRTGDGSNVGVL